MNRCRFCSAELSATFADLGMSPLSNAYVRPENAQTMEPFYPLKASVCERCFLVQVPSVASPEAIFGEYAYFSSYSTSWLDHSRRYAEEMMARLDLGVNSLVVEVASNDGYLLRWFRDAGVPVVGIEPARNVAHAAREAGIRTVSSFFGRDTAEEIFATYGGARLLIANNVLAHVPDLNDFVAGLRIALAPDGLLTLEFPHLLRLIEQNQFDTIYHEHFSYFSLHTVREIFERHNLSLVDVEEIATHGGSMRIHVKHENEFSGATDAVGKVLRDEEAAGLRSLETYEAFSEAVYKAKRELLTFLIKARNDGKRVLGYGAPAKGNTLLNYCGVRTDLLEFTVDRNPHKQGLLLPGTHIEIRDPAALVDAKPDYVLILPWNLRDEITEQTAEIRSWGGRWVVAIPSLRVIE